MAKRIRNLEGKHYEAMFLRLQGLQYREIAAKFGVAEITVRNWFCLDDLFRAEFERLKNELIEEAKHSLISAAPKAVKKLIELLDVDNPKIALEAAKDLLDRIGMKPVEKSEVAFTGQVKNEHVVAERIVEDPEARELARQLFLRTVAKDMAS